MLVLGYSWVFLHGQQQQHPLKFAIVPCFGCFNSRWWTGVMVLMIQGSVLRVWVTQIWDGWTMVNTRAVCCVDGEFHLIFVNGSRHLAKLWRTDVALMLIVSAPSCERIIGGFCHELEPTTERARNLLYVPQYPCGVHLPSFGWSLGEPLSAMMGASGCLNYVPLK